MYFINKLLMKNTAYIISFSTQMLKSNNAISTPNKKKEIFVFLKHDLHIRRNKSKFF